MGASFPYGTFFIYNHITTLTCETDRMREKSMDRGRERDVRERRGRWQARERELGSVADTERRAGSDIDVRGSQRISGVGLTAKDIL